MLARILRWTHGTVALVCLQCLVPARSVNAQADSPTPIRPAQLVFERDIVPILTSLCVHCHGWVHRQGDLDVRSLPLLLKGGKSGPAIVPGFAKGSLLIQKITSGQMPPTGKVKQQLTGKNFIVADVLPTEQDIAILRAWIEAGAFALYQGGPPTEEQAPALTKEDRTWWAFRKPERTPLGKLTDGPRSPDNQESGRTVRTPADIFSLARLREAGLSFSRPAPPAVLIRRASLDIAGIPPSPAEVDHYLADRAPDRYERLIDRLLASQHYGERWGRHWLDAAGYSEIRGREFGGKTVFLAEGIWRFRDYVINALNQDLPFDQFLLEQLAGDEQVAWREAAQFTPEIRRSLIATGFLRLAADFTAPNNNGDLDAAPLRHQVLNDTLQIIGSNLLGLTLQCAQCHSHKFEPLSQVDYYRLRGLFTPAFDPQHWVDYVHRYQYEISPQEFSVLQAANTKLDAQIAELTQQIANLRQDGSPADLSDETTRQIAELESRSRQLTASKRSPGEKIEAVWDVGPPPPQYLLRRGEFTDPGSAVTPGVPAILDSPAKPFVLPQPVPGSHNSGYRTAFARWLTDPAHPLTGRVFVNRVWQHYFGRGIVKTESNFGRSGAFPTHPLLLDWLVRDFVDQGWQLKRLHRNIVYSTTYRQASTTLPADNRARQIDPENQLLWKMPLRQMESELVRDAMLSVSGTLDRTMHGPSVPVTLMDNGLVTIDATPVYRWSRTKESIYADTLKLASPSSRFRRSIYLFARRNFHLTELSVFDQPVVQTNCTKRKPSEVVQQALTMLNSETVYTLASHFAARVTQESDNSTDGSIECAFRIALGRVPEPAEHHAVVRFLEQQIALYRKSMSETQSREFALIDLCQMLLNTSEFLYVH
ncbi:MAG: PSD1 and planctomycete cytochrome C domain-containing protein [Planctomycetota bacterium]|nr:PSD1 and planctomycete cytochrome C domain-containing protein [Planctomycetota bacterium]